MSAGSGTRVASTPPVTLTGLGPPRTLVGREAALVWALVEALPDLRGHALGKMLLSFSETAVDAEVRFRVRRKRS